MQFEFSKENIIHKIEKLENILHNVSNPEIIWQLEQDLSTLELILQVLSDGKNPEIKPNYNTIYKSLKLEMEKISFLLEDIHNYRKLTTKKMLDIPKLPPHKLTKNDLINLLHGFYSKIDSDFYLAFRQIAKQSSVQMINNHSLNLYGSFYFLHYSHESFIIINKTNTIQDFFTIAHEFAHGINFYFNDNANMLDNKYFMEIITLFMELLAADYYQITMNSHEPIIYQANEFNNQILTAREMDAFFKMLAAHQVDFKNSYIRKILNANNKGNQMYLTAYLFAIELYHLYKIDPEFCMYLIKYIISLPIGDPKNFYEQLKALDLIPNAHVLDYYQQLNQQVQTLKLVKHS